MKNLISTFLFISFTISCGIYSFNGASISKETKTITVKYFSNSAHNTANIESINDREIKRLFYSTNKFINN